MVCIDVIPPSGGRGHLLNSVGGSVIVKRAVKKYGLENFAFVVAETADNVKNRVRRTAPYGGGRNTLYRTKVYRFT